MAQSNPLFRSLAFLGKLFPDNAYPHYDELRLENDRLRKQVGQLSRFYCAVEQSPVAVVIMDAHGTIEYVNPKFARMTGYAPQDVIGRQRSLLNLEETCRRRFEEIWKSVQAGREWYGELHDRRRDGAPFWVYACLSPIQAGGAVTHFLEISEDISLHKEYEERLRHQASFDALTGLPNRTLGLDRLARAVGRMARERKTVVVMFVDLDRFKRVNDMVGHGGGDTLLLEASRRIKACVGEADTVVRLGADEFLVILPDLDRDAHWEPMVNRILNAFAAPFPLDDKHDIVVTASIGLTLAPNDGDDPQTLLRNAHAALYRAKTAGRNTYRFFAPEMNAQMARLLEMEFHLRHALQHDELSLHYQPLVDAQSGELVGAEALLRWHNAHLGAVPPDRFIPLAEDAGLIVTIGEWVLATACEQACAWQERLGTALHIAVNVSSCQLKAPGFVATVARILAQTGLAPERLELEVTENLLLEDAAETHAIFDALNDLDVTLCIDDFGTGYSSLSYLLRFPFKVLKIDRAFVRGVTTDPEAEALTTAIIAMAHSLGLTVIGEGTETEAQLEFLRLRGCDLVQGYYFSKPLPPAVFVEFAASYRPPEDALFQHRR